LVVVALSGESGDAAGGKRFPTDEARILAVRVGIGLAGGAGLVVSRDGEPAWVMLAVVVG